MDVSCVAAHLLAGRCRVGSGRLEQPAFLPACRAPHPSTPDTPAPPSPDHAPRPTLAPRTPHAHCHPHPPLPSECGRQPTNRPTAGPAGAQRAALPPRAAGEPRGAAACGVHAHRARGGAKVRPHGELRLLLACPGLPTCRRATVALLRAHSHFAAALSTSTPRLPRPTHIAALCPHAPRASPASPSRPTSHTRLPQPPQHTTPTARVRAHVCAHTPPPRPSLQFKSLPRGLFITLEDRGRVFRILKNWPERNVKLLVLSDGERVGPLGDLGVQVGGGGWSGVVVLLCLKGGGATWARRAGMGRGPGKGGLVVGWFGDAGWGRGREHSRGSFSGFFWGGGAGEGLGVQARGCIP